MISRAMVNLPLMHFSGQTYFNYYYYYYYSPFGICFTITPLHTTLCMMADYSQLSWSNIPTNIHGWSYMFIHTPQGFVTVHWVVCHIQRLSVCWAAYGIHCYKSLWWYLASVASTICCLEATCLYVMSLHWRIWRSTAMLLLRWDCRVVDIL